MENIKGFNDYEYNNFIKNVNQQNTQPNAMGE